MRRFILLLLAVLITLQSYSIIPDRKYIRLPQERGLVYKNLPVKTKDGYKIETWFFPAQDMPDYKAGQKEMLPYKTKDNKKRPTLIICNADDGNMSYMQLDLAAVYAANGYNVVTFDWRGFGNSFQFEMNRDYLCYTEMLLDYAAVIKTVAKQIEVDKKEIFLMGWSTGAYLSMIASHNNKNVKGCILVGTPSSFEDVIPQLIKVHPKRKTAANLVVPDNFPKDKMPFHIAPKFRKSVLLIVGKNDDRTPVWMSEKIYNALPEKVNKKLSVYDKAGHGGNQSPMVVDFERWMNETLDFMEGKI